MDDALDVLREWEETRSGTQVGEAVGMLDVGMSGHVDERQIMGE